MGTVLIPIPDRDFDPTEVAVSWQVLRAHGHRVVFATESGTPGAADDIMVTGRGLDLWSAIPVLGAITIVGGLLRANKDARRAYHDMLQSPEYQYPSSWAETTLDGIDALLLPGRSPRPWDALLHRQSNAAAARRGRLCPRAERRRDLLTVRWPRAASTRRPGTRCSTDAGPRR